MRVQTDAISASRLTDVCTPGTPDGALGVPQQGFAVEIVSALGEVCPTARFDASGVMLNPADAIGEIVSRGAALEAEYVLHGRDHLLVL